MNVTIFDLIADLVNDAVRFSHEDSLDSISKEYSDELQNKARTFLDKIIGIKKNKFDTKKGISSQAFNDIIDTCRTENNYLFYRYILCELDAAINIDNVISDLDFACLTEGTSDKTFECVNSNADTTGVLIIPKVHSPKSTFSTSTDSKSEDKNYKDSNHWYDNLNEHFRNIIYIKRENLRGYKLKNVLIDLFNGQPQDTIVVGLTPGCNTKLEELVKINKISDSQNRIQYFEIEKYYDTTTLTKKFLKSLQVAKNHNVDILMGAEMLGTPEMSNVDIYGFNMNFREMDGKSPHLIVTPSFWQDRKNYITVYLKSGEIIGHQYKQHAFEYVDEEKRYHENLQESPKEILVIHVPQWGRIVFPICVDYLNPAYREFLSRDLKATLMLCPSYSSGTVQFANSACSVREFGTRLIWLNSCSALRDYYESPKSIGLVSAPIISVETPDYSAKNICPDCNGECFEGCLFIVTIQLRSNNGKRCNEVEVKHILLAE